MEAIIISAIAIYFALPNKRTDYMIQTPKITGRNENKYKDESAFMLVYNIIMKGR